MANEFTGKRYITSTLMRSVFDVRTGKNYEYPPVYYVFDNKKQKNVSIKGFKPTCYEDIRSKAIELNAKEEGKKKKAK